MDTSIVTSDAIDYLQQKSEIKNRRKAPPIFRAMSIISWWGNGKITPYLRFERLRRASGSRAESDVTNGSEFGTRYTKTSCIVYIDAYTIPKILIHDTYTIILGLQLSIDVPFFWLKYYCNTVCVIKEYLRLSSFKPAFLSSASQGLCPLSHCRAAHLHHVVFIINAVLIALWCSVYRMSQVDAQVQCTNT